VNGQPSPNGIAKASSDGIGPHSHNGFGLHSHGEPSFTDEDAALLEGEGWHVDRHHNRVSDENGFRLSPATVSQILRDLRGQAGATGNFSAVSDTSVVKGISPVAVGCTAPGDVAQAAVSPVVTYLDLRGGSSGPG
jgi:hypothetical protein